MVIERLYRLVCLSLVYRCLIVGGARGGGDCMVGLRYQVELRDLFIHKGQENLAMTFEK